MNVMSIYLKRTSPRLILSLARAVNKLLFDTKKADARHIYSVTHPLVLFIRKTCLAYASVLSIRSLWQRISRPT